VWTTTPWTLPSNTATAVGRDIAYVLVEASGTAPDGSDELLVMAEPLVEQVLGATRTRRATGCWRA
jgi:isoleucyl-tRNA synthetase